MTRCTRCSLAALAVRLPPKMNDSGSCSTIFASPRSSPRALSEPRTKTTREPEREARVASRRKGEGFAVRSLVARQPSSHIRARWGAKARQRAWHPAGRRRPAWLFAAGRRRPAWLFAAGRRRPAWLFAARTAGRPPTSRLQTPEREARVASRQNGEGFAVRSLVARRPSSHIRARWGAKARKRAWRP